MVLLKSESFQWDLKSHEWHFVNEDKGVKLWINPYKDLHTQRLVLSPPNDLPAEYPNLEAHQLLFENMVKPQGGAVINIEIKAIKGIEYFSTLLKFRNPERKLAIRYLGTLMFPFENSFCGFQFQCDEHGTTGMRENMGMLVFRKKYPDDWEERWYGAKSEKSEPVVLASMDEYFKTVENTPLRRLPSDDEEYDALIPDHPLTRIRLYMKHTLETLEFANEVKRLKPYRPKSKNKFFDNWGKWN